MTQSRFFTNGPPSTLAAGLGAVSPGATDTIEVVDKTDWPTQFPFGLWIDYTNGSFELATITQASTGTGPYTYANCIRGDDGTLAPSHDPGAQVVPGLSARDFTEYARHVNGFPQGMAPSGITGAVAATRYVGGTASGHPTSGTFLKGDWVVDQTGAVWVCTTAGSPGTWTGVSGFPSTVSEQVTFEGEGSGTDGAVIAQDLTVIPNAGISTSASVFLDNQAGQVWEFFCNASGHFGVFDHTGSALALQVFGGSENAAFAGEVSALDFSVMGLTGAQAGGRFAGATVAGHPTSGTFQVGDFVVDQGGGFWVCISGGSPGTWVNAASANAETLASNNAATGAVTINLASASVFHHTLVGAVTYTFTGAVAGASYSFGLVLTQDATGGRVATWPASVKWPGGTPPTLSTGPNAVDELGFSTLDGGTTWRGALIGAGYA